MSKYYAFYETLGVKPDASASEIKRAYRSKASVAHPDKGGDASVMAELSRAYACLSDPKSRLIYDQTGAEPQVNSELERATNILLNHFDRALKSSSADDNSDSLEEVRRTVMTAMAEVTQNIEKADRLLRLLKVRRNNVRVRKKGQVNLWHRLVDDQIKQIVAGREKLKSSLEDHRRAQVMLEHYESEWPAYVQYSTTISYGTTTGGYR